MTQKQFGIVFVIALFVAVIGIFMGRLNGSSATSATPSPSPTIDATLFGNSAQNSGSGNQLNQSSDQSKLQAPGQSSQLSQQMQQQQVQGAQNPPKQYPQFPGVLPANQLQNKKAVIVMSKGTIEFEIFPDSPKAASNFIFLTNDHFYDGLTFHRVVSGFVAQGGDPAGNGSGGPGYQFEDEPVAKQYTRGTVAMANAGPNTNGSQFFIVLQDQPSLPPNYTIFGKVLTGMDVVDKIQVGDVMQSVSIESLK